MIPVGEQGKRGGQNLIDQHDENGNLHQCLDTRIFAMLSTRRVQRHRMLLSPVSAFM
jgi:hypothetical protein